MPDDAPEKEFIWASLKRCLPGASADDDLAPLLSRVNLDKLLWMGNSQKVLLWIRDALEAPGAAGRCPPEVRRQLDALRQAAQFRALARLREACLLQDRFDAAGIPALFADGWMFARCFYARPELREPGSSIGWIVHPRDRDRAQNLLSADGYKFEMDPLRLNDSKRSRLTLRGGIAPGNVAAEQNSERLWKDSSSLPTAGRNLRTLSPVHWLLYLCWRGMQNRWLNPIHAYDVAVLWLLHPKLDQAGFFEEAAVFDLKFPLANGLALSLTRFGLPVPTFVAHQVKNAQATEPATGKQVRRMAKVSGNTLQNKGLKKPTPETELSYLGRFSPTPPPVAEAMLRLAGAGPDDVVYDLGCGNGRLVIAAAKKFGARAVGVDIDPKRIEEAGKAVSTAGVAERVSLSCGDLMETDVREATVICLYIQGFAMDDIRRKLERETRPGTRVVSHNFIFPGWPPERTEIVRSGLLQAAHVYLWRIA